ncbi:unnamed protein product [Symbiodinium natans]|uniref:Uncharacterized protein n=1 Tax=Symbiodinium natans TaxID=878477 RepID=A0A812GIJ1_9DINO|nr:unnamed protein product [Symbiodinium natans]
MALPWKHGLVHSTQVFVRLLLSLAVSHAIAREVCDDISMLQQSMYKPSDAPLALMATATEAPTTTTEAPVLTPPPPPKATRVNVVGVTGIIASFDAETKDGTINKVTEICKARGFIESGECKTCNQNWPSATMCSFYW